MRACDETAARPSRAFTHALAEMVLSRQCADVSKLMYHMRINGDVVKKHRWADMSDDG